MARRKRVWVSQDSGAGYHIVSRVVGGQLLFGDQEKEYFLKLLEVFAQGFFVDIHGFTIMGNHVHILATGREADAKFAAAEELIRRYRLVYGKDAEYPIGKTESDGTVWPDEDGGIERLRNRLASISRFVQELKQTFSKWYNMKNKRTGFLWSDRFKGIIVDKGVAQLMCSAYIDLNAYRAGLVKRPEDYRWSSLGMRMRSKKRAKKFLTPIKIEAHKELERLALKIRKGKTDDLAWYREFVYISGEIEKEGKAAISAEVVKEIKDLNAKLGLGESLKFRIRNLSEGVAIGSEAFIEEIQTHYQRKFIRPRKFLEGGLLFVTRALKT